MLSALPVELDAAYIAPEAPIEDMIQPRRPRVGEWVNGYYPEPNGDSGVRRGLTMVLARVCEVVDGDYQTGGVFVEPWERNRLKFGERFFMPWCCLTSRTAVNRYSLVEA